MGAQLKQKSEERFGDVYNPATGKVISRVAFASSDNVAAAVEKAKKAFPAWANTPPMRRARVMFRFLELLHKNADHLASIISTEHGKVTVDAQSEVARGIEVVEFA